MSWLYLERLSNVALDDRSLKAAFPSLRAFTLHGDAPTIFDANLLDSVLGALSQQVDVTMARSDTLRSRPSIFVSLRNKALFDIYEYSGTEFATRPVNARLVYHPDDEYDVEFLPDFVSALGADPDLSQLSLLYLPPVLSEENVSNSADNSNRQELLNLCQDRKIEVVFEENTGSRVKDSIVSQDFWRRRRELRREGEAYISGTSATKARPSLRVKMNVNAPPAPLATRALSLLSLPDELLKAIFKAGGPYFKVPLACKRFVPFYRAQMNYERIYRTIKIKSDKTLLKLALCQIAVDQVEAMFNRLPNLVTLSTVDSGGRLCDGFLKADSAKCGMNLEHLHLEADRVQKMVEDPFSAANMTALAKRTKLTKLELIFGSMPYPSNPAPFTTEQIALPSLKSIALSGDLTGAAPAFKFLLAHSKPSVVVLDDSSRHPRLTNVLSVCVHCESVNLLSLSCRVHSTAPQEFRQDLVQFKNLTQLKLSGGAMSGASSPFHTALRKLTTLEELSFGRFCDVSAAALVHLVSGDKKLRTLTEVRLDNVWSKKGTYIASKTAHDWILPKWTSKFTSKGLDKLDKAAREGHVVLSGSALRARDMADRFTDAHAAAMEKAKDRAQEARWVSRKQECDLDEANEILDRRDERNKIYYGSSGGSDDDEGDDEDEEEEDAIWKT
ncbi:hypothetical protein JCM3766R1_003561 [Sporobolomyces carnicolor]